MRNPLMSYKIRDNGTIVVIFNGEIGETVELLYSELDELFTAAHGYEDAAYALTLFYSEGYEAAEAYLNEGAVELEITQKMLNSILEDRDD